MPVERRCLNDRLAFRSCMAPGVEGNPSLDIMWDEVCLAFSSVATRSWLGLAFTHQQASYSIVRLLAVARNCSY
jgi:hypothetical protein